MIAPFKQRDTDRETWERECVCVWFGWNSVGSTAKTMSMFAIDNKRCSQLLVLQQTIFNWVSNVFLYVFCFRSNWIRRHIRRERKKDKRELNHRFTRIENAPLFSFCQVMKLYSAIWATWWELTRNTFHASIFIRLHWIEFCIFTSKLNVDFSFTFTHQ